MVAHHLVHLAGSEGPSILLFERAPRVGPGVAYATTSAAHLLNVPAGRMSAIASDSDHFLRWCTQRGMDVQGGSFVPRSVYGQYLADIASSTAASAAGQRLRIKHAVVTAARPLASSVEITTADGGHIVVDRAVLALGNDAPGSPPIASSSFYTRPHYTRDPWSGRGIPDLDPASTILLIGTGLTMMDVALELTARGHTGPLIALSRRGLLSQAHRGAARPYHRDRPGDLELWPATARGYLRRLRRAVLEAAGKGVDWREVVTSIRHDTPWLWNRLSTHEQKRFLRHIRPYWDTHRHRAAPATWAGIEALLNAGRLTIRAGRLVDLLDMGPDVEVVLRARGAAQVERLRVGHVINCTGPETDPSRIDNPLLHDLLSRGIARVDPLGLGLESQDDYRLISRDGRPWDTLLLVGPMRRPRLWETTAVPELRVHAELVARHLLGIAPASPKAHH